MTRRATLVIRLPLEDDVIVCLDAATVEDERRRVMQRSSRWTVAEALRYARAWCERMGHHEAVLVHDVERACMTECSPCGYTFAGTSAFDAHRVGVHAYTWREGLAMEPPREDGRRCLQGDEFELAGLARTIAVAGTSWRTHNALAVASQRRTNAARGFAETPRRASAVLAGSVAGERARPGHSSVALASLHKERLS